MKDSDPFIQNIKKNLDQQTLPQDIPQKLATARQQALRQPEPGNFTRHGGALIAFASIFALALAVTLTLLPEQESLEVHNAEAFEIITSNEPLEMYQELEFYLWLDEQPKV